MRCQAAMGDGQPTMLANRVRKNLRHLRKWARRDGVSCYRIYDKDIPEIPLAIDWYDGRLHIAEYEQTRDVPDGWAEGLASHLGRDLGVPAEQVYLKTRKRQRGKDQYERVADRGERFVVEEHGLRLWVNLADYLDTGLFLDHRPTRKQVGAEARGKAFLNLFCYTGAFTVHAVAGGALRSLSLDLSNTYTSWAEDNLALNDTPRGHVVRRADVLGFLAADGPPEYDLAVIDPPTFSNSKSMQGTFDVQRDHVWLLERSLSRMHPGGVIYFSTNSRRFKLGEIPGAEVEDISEATIPPDFRNTRIHRCYRLRVR